MKRKTEKTYLKKEWKTMRGHLRSFFKKGKQEDIHRFRVQVKKLSAFMVLADSNRGNRVFEKCFKPVKKIFKMAGEVRDPFVNLEMAGANHITDEAFIIAQHLKIRSATKKFKANAGKKLKKIRVIKVQLEKYIKPVSDVHINIYYERELKHIAELLAGNKFGYELHDCRKLVKILIYNYELVRPALTGGFNEDHMENMQTAIGDWHDNILATDLLTGQKLMNKTVTNNLNKKNKELEKQISSLIPDFYNRATNVMELAVEQID